MSEQSRYCGFGHQKGEEFIKDGSLDLQGQRCLESSKSSKVSVRKPGTLHPRSSQLMKRCGETLEVRVSASQNILKVLKSLQVYSIHLHPYKHLPWPILVAILGKVLARTL
jgi:hypothetical protein